MAETAAPRFGHRERKRRATRAAIQRAALQLFLEKGYEQTTTSEIAAAADVSPGTLFNYFGRKEDLILDEDDPYFIALFEARPADEPLLVAVGAAMRQFIGPMLAEAGEELWVRARLIGEVPALRGASLVDRERSAGQLQRLLAKRLGSRDEFELNVMAVVIVAAISNVMDEWFRSEGQADVLALMDRALGIIGRGIDAVAIGREAPKP